MKRLAIILAIILIPTLCFGADYRAECVVGFTGTGTHGDAYRPNIGAYTINKFEDVTGTPGEHILPDPNMYVIKIEADNATLDQMVTDGIIELWREKIVAPGPGPGASLVGKTLTMLSSLLVSEAWAADTKASGNPHEKPDKQKLDKIKQDLKQKGMKDADINKTALGNTNTANLTRQELARQLADVMKTFPKKP